MEQLQEGFTGELPKVHLADILQLHSQNGFSGGLSVQQNTSKGVVFFNKGQVIHAEQNDISGIDAIYRMLGWKGGQFACLPNLKTMHSSINMSMSQLLLECHRRLDEEGVVDTEEVTKMPEAGNKTVQKISPIPGVNFAVLIDDNGHPDNDSSSSASRLSAQGHFFADVGKKLGALLGADGYHFSVVTGSGGHCLNFQSNNRALVVATPGNCEYQPIESAIRSTLARK